MSEWIKCSDRMPKKPVLVVVWRRWPGQDEFGPDFDCWENVDACSGQCDWVLSEDACQGIECIADGPGIFTGTFTDRFAAKRSLINERMDTV